MLTNGYKPEDKGSVQPEQNYPQSRRISCLSREAALDQGKAHRTIAAGSVHNMSHLIQSC